MRSWKQRIAAVPILGPALRWVKRLLLLPIRFVHTVAQGVNSRRYRNALQDQVLRDFAESCVEVRCLRRRLDQLLSECAESRAEVRRLKHRYAEYYGAIVEQLQEQNRRLQQVAEQQEGILHTVKPPANVLPLDHPTARLPQAS
jgi:DNA anti-recombination protein RmuC